MVILLFIKVFTQTLQNQQLLLHLQNLIRRLPCCTFLLMFSTWHCQCTKHWCRNQNFTHTLSRCAASLRKWRVSNKKRRQRGGPQNQRVLKRSLREGYLRKRYRAPHRWLGFQVTATCWSPSSNADNTEISGKGDIPVYNLKRERFQ